MILLITPSARAQECAEALQQATNENTHVAATFQQAVAQMRAQEFLAVVLDQSLLDAEPDASEMALQHIGMAMPVYVNLAISGVERVVRELRAALRRRKHEVVLARRGAVQVLGSELKGPLTALLLSCELALQVPGLPEAAQIKVRAAYDLAREMRCKIGLMDEDSALSELEVAVPHR